MGLRMFKRAVEPGTVFGKLITIAPVTYSGNGKGQVWCICECGTEICLYQYRLKNGATKSCSCLRRQRAELLTKSHGQTKSRTYTSWYQMRTRCNNPNHHAFKDYGGRGIAVCERWNKFENFLADMGERPQGHSIDRIDVNGSYSPENCKWSTPKEQQNNRRVTRRAGSTIKP